MPARQFVLHMKCAFTCSHIKSDLVKVTLSDNGALPLDSKHAPGFFILWAFTLELVAQYENVIYAPIF